MSSFSPLASAIHAWACPLKDAVTARIQAEMGARVRAMTGATGDARDFLQPAGDPGLFGPDAVT